MFRTRLPSLAILSFLVTIAYVPGVAGFAYVGRWGVLAIGLPVLVLLQKPGKICECYAGIVFLFYATASLAWSPIWPEALNGWFQLVLVAAAFSLGIQAKDVDQVIAGCAAGICVNAGFVALQLAGFVPVEVIDGIQGPPGLFGNKNFLGEAAALGLIGTVATRQWIWTPGCAFAVLFAQCRGAWVGLALAAIVWLWHRQRIVALLLICAMLLGVRMVIGTTVNGNIGQRLAIWGDTYDGLTLLGRGTGSYQATVAEHGHRMAALLSRTAHAHNDLLEALYEYGIGSALLVIVVWQALWAGAAPASREDRLSLEPARLVFITFLGAGLVGFPFHQPATGFLAALMAGHLYAAGARLRRELAYRGIRRGIWHAAWRQQPHRAFAAALGLRYLPAQPLPAQPAGPRGAGSEPVLTAGIRDC